MVDSSMRSGVGMLSCFCFCCFPSVEMRTIRETLVVVFVSGQNLSSPSTPTNPIIRFFCFRYSWGPQGYETTGEFHGYEGVMYFFDEHHKQWTLDDFEPDATYYVGNGVVIVEGHESGVMSTGEPMSINWVHKIQFESDDADAQPKMVDFWEWMTLVVG